MFGKRANRLLPAGLLMPAGGLLLGNRAAGGYSELVVGFLIGMSLVFIIAGLGKRSHAHHPQRKKDSGQPWPLPQVPKTADFG